MGWPKGMKHSEGAKRKISEGLRGRKLSPEHRKKLSEAHKGKKLSLEHRRKLSEARKGRRFGKESPMWGKNHSDEARRKMSEARSGEKNCNWKGGIIRRATGKVYILVGREHPMADSAGYIRRSRLIMSQMLGHPLTREEIVHHKDGDVSNDDPKNLRLFLGHVEHLAFHHKKKQVKSFLS